MSELLLGDCVEVMAGMDAGSVDAVVTDPPYGIGFMGKTWDDFGGPLGVGHGMNRAGGREPGGAMKAGDSYDRTPTGNRAFQAWVELWASECLRLLKPGGHLVSFGGTRTYHRLAAGVEDAGFEIRDQLAWLFGSGFPKSRNLGDGYGTALKPAHEPIVLARKPLVGTVADNVALHGVGGLNIDGCRVEGVKGDGNWAGAAATVRGEALGYDGGWEEQRTTPDQLGRWPANVVLDEEAASMLDEQTGELTSGEWNGQPTGATQTADAAIYGVKAARPYFRDSDRGGASRFFYCAKTSRAERNAGLEGFDGQTAGSLVGWAETGDTRVGRIRSDGAIQHASAPTHRNVHPTVKPIALMRWLARLITPPGGLILDPFLGSGTTGIAAALEGFRFVGIEREPDYMAIAQARIAFWEQHGDEALRIAYAIDERDAIQATGQTSLLDQETAA